MSNASSFLLLKNANSFTKGASAIRSLSVRSAGGLVNILIMLYKFIMMWNYSGILDDRHPVVLLHFNGLEDVLLDV